MAMSESPGTNCRIICLIWYFERLCKVAFDQTGIDAAPGGDCQHLGRIIEGVNVAEAKCVQFLPRKTCSGPDIKHPHCTIRNSGRKKFAHQPGRQVAQSVEHGPVIGLRPIAIKPAGFLVIGQIVGPLQQFSGFGVDCRRYSVGACHEASVSKFARQATSRLKFRIGLKLQNVITTVVPVFALIVLGFGAGRFGFFVAGSARGLSTFVFTFAIPAMLFKAMVTLGIPASPPWGLWGAFFTTVAIIWVLAIAASHVVTGLEGAGGSSAALGSAFGNTVMLGLPLGVAHFGAAAVLPMALIISIHLPVQWFAATLLAQWGSRSGKQQKLSSLLRTLVKDLFTNPIVLALLAGTAWNLAGFGLHSMADNIVSMLAQAAVPAALFALGLSLARFGLMSSGLAAAVLMFLKLAVMPAVAALLAFEVFDLSMVQAGIVVLFAALPTGANAYIFAERQAAAEAAVSASVAAGTALSIVTLSIVLALLPQV